VSAHVNGTVNKVELFNDAGEALALVQRQGL